jgi:hypothetical protein
MNTSISPPVSADFIEKNVPAYRESQGIPGPFISSIPYIPPLIVVDRNGMQGNEQSPLKKKKEERTDVLPSRLSCLMMQR